MKKLEILGYGEDSLTFWFLRNKLKCLDKSCKPSDFLVFYRPSFGRGGGACFGEFDAIVATRSKIYLIESKRNTSRGISKNQIKLSDAQKLRHQILAWYLCHPEELKSWSFSKKRFKEFKKEFKKKSIPKENTQLVSTLQSLSTKIVEHIDKLSARGKIENIILFFYEGNSIPELQKPNNFKCRLIPIKYPTKISQWIPLGEVKS